MGDEGNKVFWGMERKSQTALTDIERIRTSPKELPICSCPNVLSSHDLRMLTFGSGGHTVGADGRVVKLFAGNDLGSHSGTYSDSTFSIFYWFFSMIPAYL